jgi:hypothetical protein
MAVIVVLPTTVTAVAALPPKITVAPAAKFVPVMVRAVPPVVEPEFGETLLTVGAGFVALYVKPLARVAL